MKVCKNQSLLGSLTPHVSSMKRVLQSGNATTTTINHSIEAWVFYSHPDTIYADCSKIIVKELALAWIKNPLTSSFISRLCVCLTHTQRNQSLNGTYPYKIAISQVTWRKRARNGNRAFETLNLFWWRKLHILHTIGSIQIRPRAMCMNSVDYSKRIDHWVTIDKEQYC